MAKDNNVYTPLDEKDLQGVWNKHKEIIDGFILSNKYNANNICIDESALLSVITKVDQRRQYFEVFHHLNMSEYKEAALHSFWYVKLRPVNIKTDDTGGLPQEYDCINEKIAVYIILKTLRAALNAKQMSDKKLDELPTKYINELIYSFTYRDISKEALIMLVESIAVFLGLDPDA